MRAKNVLTVLVIGCLAMTAGMAQAGLLSLYSFDNTANNSVATATNGTLMNGATYGTGFIGSAALSLANSGLSSNYQYVDATTSGFPKASNYGDLPASNGLWTGSTSYWINTPSLGSAAMKILGCVDDTSVYQQISSR